MQLWQNCLLVTAKLLYMFRTFLRPSSGVLTTVEAATGACHAVNYKATYKQVLCVVQAVIEY
jgi:hypothetical protein